MQNKIVVYTAVTGGYDSVRPIHYQGCDFVCFTDEDIKIPGWEVRSLPFKCADQVRTARAIKLLPHKLFEEYEISIWVDGNIMILRDPARLVRKLDKAIPMYAFAHPTRTTLPEELHACHQQGKDDVSVMTGQVNEYLAEGCPRQGNVIESNVLIRRHKNSEVINAMELWWNQIQAYSRRDQLSFPYVAWKTGIRYRTMDRANARGGSKYFLARRHSGEDEQRANSSYLKKKLHVLRNTLRRLNSRF